MQSDRKAVSWIKALAAAIALTATACGHVAYAIEVSSAAQKLEEARQLGAETLAPYEYYYAREHLKKAQSEAAEADYGDAIDLAAESEQYSERAIRLARGAHRGAGR